LRTAQQRDISELDVAIEKAREAGLPNEALSHLIATRDRMRSALE
jgi:hypothetical protein